MRTLVMCKGGIEYVEECRKRGLEPIIINPPGVFNGIHRFKRFAGEYRSIDMETLDDYDKVLDKVRELDPVAVVCGAEGAVHLTDRLAHDLGMKGNDPETTYLRDTKNGMHKALKDAGIRYIRTATVSSKKEIEKFWKDVKPKKVIMKYDSSAGSYGNKICENVKESTDYLKVISKGKNVYGLEDKVLIQEFIEGDEYVVDTVSCDGHHTVAFIWKYNKIITPDGDIPYDETKLIVDPEPGIPELVQYAFKVLDATGFRYGPCHGEYKIDEKGPVLIETNPRLHGTSIISEYMSEIQDNIIADLAVDAYIAPDSFFSRSLLPYKPKKYAVFKHLIMPKDSKISYPMLRTLVGNMESFRYTANDIIGGKTEVHKTIDCVTTPAILKFCNSDYIQLRRDCDLITQLESKYFGILEQGDDKVKAVKVKSKLAEISAPYVLNRKTLVITDKGKYVTRSGMKMEDRDDGEKYGALIYADASSSKMVDRFQSIIDSVNEVMGGGTIVIAPEVYENLPYGRISAEIAVFIAGCTLEARLACENLVVARKK